ncbi:MAG: hypothetical protein U0Q16_37175 [Bryobacteraceae bacterium]
MRTLFAGLALAGLMAGQVSHPSFWRYTHPEARVLVGADLRNVVGSSLWRTVKSEIEQSGVSIKESSQTNGVDLLNDVDRLLVSSPGPRKGAKSASDAPVVIALSGRFNLAAIRKEFLAKGARKSIYKGVEVLSPDRKRTDLHAALASPRVLLFGDLASLRAAIDKDPVPEDAEVGGLLGRARELAELHDVWFVSDIPPDALQQGASAGFGMQGLRGFEGGLSFQSGFALEVALSTDSDKTAQQTGAMFQGFAQMAAAGQDDGTRDLLSRIRIGVTGNQITASLRYSDADIRQAMALARTRLSAAAGGAKQPIRMTAPVAAADSRPAPRAPRTAMASSFTAPAPQPAATPAPAPRVQPEPKPLVVKIYNAEDGVREHPLAKD